MYVSKLPTYRFRYADSASQLSHDASTRRVDRDVPDQRRFHHVHLQIHRPLLGICMWLGIRSELAACAPVRSLGGLQRMFRAQLLATSVLM